MELRIVLVTLSLLCSAAADEGSCVGRCDLGFQLSMKCQCFALCSYYSSCCRDYHSVCEKALGDEFAFLDDEVDRGFANRTDYYSVVTWPYWFRKHNQTVYYTEINGTDIHPEPEPEPSVEPEPSPEPTNVCTSKKPFDAITELQNASMVAFVGKYLYELNDKGVADGYPKLIEDVWGVQGPIDAAFTRINCEGKTYLFKGKLYWCFHNGVMEAGFPKLIRDGFPRIPENVDAALALPAPGIRGKEQVYFFKGRSYWKYVFRSQPSQEECGRASISVPFRRYVHFLHLDWEEDFFTELFGSPGRDGTFGPYPIGRHWRGLPTRVDSAVIGKHFAVRKLIARHHGKRPHPQHGRMLQPHHGMMPHPHGEMPHPHGEMPHPHHGEMPRPHHERMPRPHGEMTDPHQGMMLHPQGEMPHPHQGMMPQMHHWEMTQPQGVITHPYRRMMPQTHQGEMTQLHGEMPHPHGEMPHPHHGEMPHPHQGMMLHPYQWEMPHPHGEMTDPHRGMMPQTHHGEMTHLHRGLMPQTHHGEMPHPHGEMTDPHRGEMPHPHGEMTDPHRGEMPHPQGEMTHPHRRIMPQTHHGEMTHPHRGMMPQTHQGEITHPRHGEMTQRHSGKRWPNSSREKHHSSDDERSFIVVPSQSVYFFSGGDYYRVDLETKRVAFARPPYPRSIAKDWFKCKDVSE